MVKQSGEMETNPNRGWKAYLSLVVQTLKSLLLIVLFPISFIAVFLSVFPMLDASTRKPVLDSVPRMFPLLVLVPGEADGQLRGHFVYHKDLDEFLETHPEHTFLIPEESEEAIRAQLDRENRYHRRDFDWESPDPWRAWFQIDEREPGRQKLLVFATWDDDRVNMGWYEATDQNFTPTHYKFSFDPGLAMQSFFMSGVITVFLWIVVALFLRRRRRLRMERMKEDITLFDGIANTQERTPASDQR